MLKTAFSMMGGYAVINILLLAVAILHPGGLGAGAILLTSFFMSIMFPTIFAMGIKELGQDTKLSGFLIVMSVVGGGIIPPILGLVAKRFGSYALGIRWSRIAIWLVAVYGMRNQSPALCTQLQYHYRFTLSRGPLASDRCCNFFRRLTQKRDDLNTILRRFVVLDVGNSQSSKR
jgi:hypothetical protein